MIMHRDRTPAELTPRYRSDFVNAPDKLLKV